CLRVTPHRQVARRADWQAAAPVPRGGRARAARQHEGGLMAIIKDKRRRTYSVIWREVIADSGGQPIVKQRWRRGFRTKSAAVEWERANVADRHSRYHHTSTLPSTMTFAAFVERIWRPAFAARSSAPATRRTYGQILSHHILPKLGDEPVRDLDRVAVHDFLA